MEKIIVSDEHGRFHEIRFHALGAGTAEIRTSITTHLISRGYRLPSSNERELLSGSRLPESLLRQRHMQPFIPPPRRLWRG